MRRRCRRPWRPPPPHHHTYTRTRARLHRHPSRHTPSYRTPPNHATPQPATTPQTRGSHALLREAARTHVFSDALHTLPHLRGGLRATRQTARPPSMSEIFSPTPPARGRQPIVSRSGGARSVAVLRCGPHRGVHGASAGASAGARKHPHGFLRRIFQFDAESIGRGCRLVPTRHHLSLSWRWHRGGGRAPLVCFHGSRSATHAPPSAPPRAVIACAGRRRRHVARHTHSSDRHHGNTCHVHTADSRHAWRAWAPVVSSRTMGLRLAAGRPPARTAVRPRGGVHADRGGAGGRTSPAPPRVLAVCCRANGAARPHAAGGARHCLRRFRDFLWESSHTTRTCPAHSTMLLPVLRTQSWKLSWCILTCRNVVRKCGDEALKSVWWRAQEFVVSLLL